MISRLRLGIWLFGLACWLFGISDRLLSARADSVVESLEIVQLFTALFFFLSWILLKPSSES